MRGGNLLVAAAAVVWWPSAGIAALIVNPAQPITHRVSVQMIQTAKTDGSSPATVFGNATQRADIEASVDKIWAQAGIDVAFLPTITRYNNTFAYEGNGGYRINNELNTILSNATAAGVANSTPSVINQFFVSIVPGFSFTNQNTANGIANIGVDGTAQFVGASLLTFQNGRDVIASVVAHEIGHVLGLKHVASGLPNLMSSQGTTAQLSAAQIAAVLQPNYRNDSVAFIPSGGTGFPQLVPQTLAGDYNRNGVVDAADYTVWRNSAGSRTNLTADGNRDQVVDIRDYQLWKANYGLRGASSAAVGGSVAVPEPLAHFHLLTVAVLLVGARRRRNRGFVGGRSESE